MATLKVSTTNVERNNFDYLRAYAENQSSNITIVNELVKAYVLISQNLGISPYDLIQSLESKGSQYMAQQMNSIRPRNAYLGVILNNNVPVFIQREIAS